MRRSPGEVVLVHSLSFKMKSPPGSVNGLVLSLIAVLYTGSKASPTPLIIGGEEAQPGEFPWLVSVQAYSSSSNSFVHICGGTIIDLENVVTAAHCMGPYTEMEIRIVAGAHNLAHQEWEQQIVQTAKITRHLEYNLPLLFRNDIAVLKVHPRFNDSNRVKALQMPPNRIESSGSCTVAGWGWTSENAGVGSDVVRKVDVPVVTKECCYRIYPQDFHSESQMCAGRDGGNADACLGDTGGALICDDLGYKYFAGIASYGYMCGRAGQPGVYTEVSQFIQWIQQSAFQQSDIHQS